MRKKFNEQLPLMNSPVKHALAEEYKAVDQILNENSFIYDLAHMELTDTVKMANAGAHGMTTEQVVKAAIIKHREGFSYEELSFHIKDSDTYRKFCRIGIADKAFSPATLCTNIKSISPETWEMINGYNLGYAKDQKFEMGREVRVDCTVADTNIHEPRDSNQLWDCVRVLARILNSVNARFGNQLKLVFTDHSRRAKRRMLAVMNAKNQKQRKKAYMDLLKVTRKTVGYSQKAVSKLSQSQFQDPLMAVTVVGIIADLNHYIHLALKVIDQTQRRIIKKEHVPAAEKVVSIFEPHTDVIVKDRREPLYGHKICLTGAKSNLILDCVILEGNPADSTLVDQMLERQKDIYDRYPLKAAFDGGFASKDNIKIAKDKGIKDVCFAKRRGINQEDMCRSEYVYKRLRKFRAGIESGISWLKRCFGLRLCNWKGFRAFKSYIWSAIVSANLFTLARLKLKQNSV